MGLRNLSMAFHMAARTYSIELTGPKGFNHIASVLSGKPVTFYMPFFRKFPLADLKTDVFHNCQRIF